MNALATYASTETFYAANEARRSSPEWDFGVHWHEHARQWPLHRLSWVVETGELILVRLGVGDSPVRVVAVIPKVGDYPYRDNGVRKPDAWTAFKDAQDVERILDGWAMQGGDLDWLEAQLAAHIIDPKGEAA